jgi:gluconokinase
MNNNYNNSNSHHGIHTSSNNEIKIPTSIIIIMGPSGCGKSTIGKQLATRLECPFEDADDYHSVGAKHKMATGTPLTDQDRLPWLKRLQDSITKYRNKQECAVFACSALKKSYRLILCSELATSQIANMSESIADSIPLDEIDRKTISSDIIPLTKEGTAIPVYYLLLKASIETLQKRLAQRHGHYFSPTLLNSQLQTLEVPGGSEFVKVINAEQSVDDVVNECVNALQSFLSNHHS